MSRSIKVLTQDLSGSVQINLNNKPFVFTENMLLALSALAAHASVTDEGYVKFTTVELSATK